MDECIDSLKTARIIDSELQQRILAYRNTRERSTKTGFLTHQRLFQFIWMAFDLRNAPATFWRAINIILSTWKWNLFIVHLDSIIFLSNNVDENLEQITQVLMLLRQASMKIRLNKCFFMKERIEYLGQIVEPGELHGANKVIDAVQEMEPPKTKHYCDHFWNVQCLLKIRQRLCHHSCTTK